MKKIIRSLLGAALLLLSAGPSQAITLSFNPIAQNIAAGSPVDVALVISGLGDGIAPSLSTFDVDVSFDPGILDFSAVTFSPLLGDLAFGEAVTSFDGSVPGVVNLFELSLLEGDSVTCIFCIPPFLDDLQPASFILATITFDSLSAGTSTLGIKLNALADAFGEPLTAEASDANITVNGSSVPESTALMLLGAGLMVFRITRQRRISLPNRIS